MATVKVGDRIRIISKGDNFHMFAIGSIAKVTRINYDDTILAIGKLEGPDIDVEQILYPVHYKVIPEVKRPKRETTNDKNKGLYGI